MDRYQYTKITAKDQTLKTTALPNVPFQDTDLFIISRDGDRLDLLANEFYQDPSLWWFIAQANSIGKGTVVVPAGQQIRIPNPIDNTFVLDILRDAEENR